MEIWKTIPGFEGRYEVSNIGNVRALNYNKTGVIKDIKQWYCHGYKHVVIQKEGKRYYYRTHRLVCWAFYGYSELQVNHKNGIKDDNRVENLEWCTNSENIKHAFKTGLVKNNSFQKNHPDKGKTGGLSRFAKKVIVYNDSFYKEYSSQSEASIELGINHTDISACLNGRQKTAKGYKFKRI